MIEIKIKRRTKDKMDKHLQSHSPAQLSQKYRSVFLIWQFLFPCSTPDPLFGRRSRLFKSKSGMNQTFTFYTCTATDVPNTWQHPGLTSSQTSTLPYLMQQLLKGWLWQGQTAVVRPSLSSPKQPVYSKLKPKTLHWLPVTVVKLIAPSSSYRLGKESHNLQLTPKNDTAYERKKIRCEAKLETQMRAHACGTLTNAHALQGFRIGSKHGSFKSTNSPMAARHRAVASFDLLLKYYQACGFRFISISIANGRILTLGLLVLAVGMLIGCRLVVLRCRYWLIIFHSQNYKKGWIFGLNSH